jgi:hypothetical protein
LELSTRPIVALLRVGGATDNAMSTEPVEVERRWLSVPGETLRQYACSWKSDHLQR